MTAVLAPADAGYQVVDGVLDRGEANELYRAIEGAAARSRAGARHLMSHPAVREVAHDPRLFSLAVSFLGPTAVPYRATLFDKSPGRNWLVPWHQDTALPLERRIDVVGWGPWSVKAGII